MADENTTTDTDENKTDTEATTTDASQAANTDADIEAIAAKAENPDAVKKALHAERAATKKATKEAAALATKIKEYEDRDKTEQEKLADENDALKAKVSPLELENLRLRVALEKGLPTELIDRLKGADHEEMAADADKLLTLVAKTDGARGDADQGARGGGADQLGREALKNMSPAEVVEATNKGRFDNLAKTGT
jgi:hypothetical protein